MDQRARGVVGAPAITGLAQVLILAIFLVAESYAIDLWYLHHREILLDIWIVFVTPLSMVGWTTVGQWPTEQASELANL